MHESGVRDTLFHPHLHPFHLQQDVKDGRKGKPRTRKENPPAFLNVGAPRHRSGTEQQRSLCFDLILIDFQLTGVSTPLLPLLSHSSQLRPNHLEGTPTTTTEPVLCFSKHAKNK